MDQSKHAVKRSPKDKDARVCPGCGNRMVRRSKQCRNCSGKRLAIPHPDPTKRYIALTQGKAAEVDVIDYERVVAYKWAAKRSHSCKQEKWYAVRTEWVDGKCVFIQMHRFILGVTNPVIQVDHRRTKETLNNCRENLRLATPSQNQANRSFTRSISGYKGVAKVYIRKDRTTGGGWRGEIVVNGKRTVGPIVQDPILAARWYDAAVLHNFKEFANINFPQD